MRLLIHFGLLCIFILNVFSYNVPSASKFKLSITKNDKNYNVKFTKCEFEINKNVRCDFKFDNKNYRIIFYVDYHTSGNCPTNSNSLGAYINSVKNYSRYMDDSWSETQNNEVYRVYNYGSTFSLPQMVLNYRFKFTFSSGCIVYADYNRNFSIIQPLSRIYIRILNKTEVYPISVDGSDTIEDVMLKIERSMGIPYSQQRLVYGQQLEYGHTLDHYNIQQDTVITLILLLNNY